MSDIIDIIRRKQAISYMDDKISSLRWKQAELVRKHYSALYFPELISCLFDLQKCSSYAKKIELMSYVQVYHPKIYIDMIADAEEILKQNHLFFTTNDMIKVWMADNIKFLKCTAA